MKNLTPDTNDCIEVCNSLLRGEISAIETYAQAVEKYKSEPQITTLEEIRDEHVENANALRQNIKAMGGTPDRDSGVWGTLAKAIQATANLLGENSAQKALLEGEEHGLKEYREALANDNVMPECKETIRTELLPRIEGHIAKLNLMTKCS